MDLAFTMLLATEQTVLFKTHFDQYSNWILALIGRMDKLLQVVGPIKQLAAAVVATVPILINVPIASTDLSKLSPLMAPD